MEHHSFYYVSSLYDVFTGISANALLIHNRKQFLPPDDKNDILCSHLTVIPNENSICPIF